MAAIGEGLEGIDFFSSVIDELEEMRGIIEMVHRHLSKRASEDISGNTDLKRAVARIEDYQPRLMKLLFSGSMAKFGDEDRLLKDAIQTNEDLTKARELYEKVAKEESANAKASPASPRSKADALTNDIRSLQRERTNLEEYRRMLMEKYRKKKAALGQ